MSLIQVILLLAGIAGLCWLSWASLQSFQQSRVLKRALIPPGGEIPVDATVALYGKPMVTRPIPVRGFGNILWIKTRHQERRGYGKRRRWVTVRSEEDYASFEIETDTETLRVADHATEMQGRRKRSDYGGGLGFLGFGGHSRTLYHWFPTPGRITAVGRVEARAGAKVVVKDAKVGLFLSGKPPQAAANTELAKAIGGFVLITVAILLGLHLFGFLP
jgi:hypothetical protein